MSTAKAAWGSVPFPEQIQMLLAKRLVPTRRWYDVWQEGHDTGFMVAGATKAELLADLHTALLSAAANGTTLEQFRKDFDAAVARHGWTGWTGSETAAGRAWRTRVIYETNLRQAYTAGRWAQIDAVRADRPYVLRRHADGVMRPRPLHLEWDGMIIPSDDPFCVAHPGGEGWGCKCKWFAVGDSDLARYGKTKPDQAPTVEYYDWTNPKTGEVRQVPVGADPGFGHRPGGTRNLADELRRRAATLPGPLGASLRADINGELPPAPPAPPAQ